MARRGGGMNLFCETPQLYYSARRRRQTKQHPSTIPDGVLSKEYNSIVFAKVHETGNVVSFYLATYFTLVYNNTKYKTLSFFIPFHLALYICTVYLSTDCIRNIEPKDTSTNDTKLQPRILLFLYFFTILKRSTSFASLRFPSDWIRNVDDLFFFLVIFLTAALCSLDGVCCLSTSSARNFGKVWDFCQKNGDGSPSDSLFVVYTARSNCCWPRFLPRASRPRFSLLY